MKIIIRKDYQQLSQWTAAYIAERINNFKPTKERPFVLGLPTGSSPLGTYKALIKLNKERAVSFENVVTFNMDEYVGLAPNHPQSYHYFMHENLFKHINIPPQNNYIPSGTTDNYEAFCKWYEQRIDECGGIDVQILGIGSDGHIAFNEPSSSLGSRTRIKTLAKETIDDNARFFERREDVPDLVRSAHPVETRQRPQVDHRAAVEVVEHTVAHLRRHLGVAAQDGEIRLEARERSAQLMTYR